jgi:hypothetical protein
LIKTGTDTSETSRLRYSPCCGIKTTTRQTSIAFRLPAVRHHATITSINPGPVILAVMLAADMLEMGIALELPDWVWAYTAITLDS